MANPSKTVKFEVGDVVQFGSNRFGTVSHIAKNGSVYVTVLGETTVVNQAREELRVKKSDMVKAIDAAMTSGIILMTKGAPEQYIKPALRANLFCKVTARAEMTEAGVYKLAPEYIPSHDCLEYCEWEGSASAARVLELVGLDLVKLANLYTGKSKAEVGEAAKPLEDAAQQASVVQESIEPMGEPIQSTLSLESTEESQSLADAKYALRELTFSVTRHSVLTAFIDVALNKHIPNYHHQVAGNLKNLMAAAFDPVHDASGYARINTWTMAALELVVKNKERVSQMLSQPIEAAPIKIDRVTKLGLWIDRMMYEKGAKVMDDINSAYDSCYVYNPVDKKLEACYFAVVEVIQSGDQGEMSVIPMPAFGKEPTPFKAYLTAQSAIQMRKQVLEYDRALAPDLHLYCGIVPVYKTGLSMQAAIEESLADAIGRFK